MTDQYHNIYLITTKNSHYCYVGMCKSNRYKSKVLHSHINDFNKYTKNKNKFKKVFHVINENDLEITYPYENLEYDDCIRCYSFLLDCLKDCCNNFKPNELTILNNGKIKVVKNNKTEEEKRDYSKAYYNTHKNNYKEYYKKNKLEKSGNI